MTILCTKPRHGWNGKRPKSEASKKCSKYGQYVGLLLNLNVLLLSLFNYNIASLLSIWRSKSMSHWKIQRQLARYLCNAVVLFMHIAFSGLLSYYMYCICYYMYRRGQCWQSKCWEFETSRHHVIPQMTVKMVWYLVTCIMWKSPLLLYGVCTANSLVLHGKHAYGRQYKTFVLLFWRPY